MPILRRRGLLDTPPPPFVTEAHVFSRYAPTAAR